MSWKKIAVLVVVLAVLAAAIFLVERREKNRQASEGVLLDIPAADVERIELRNRLERLSFSRRDVLWHMDAPLAAKADKVTLENILDNFCRLKYDRLVAENGELKDFGLDRPEIELTLHAKGRPATTILLGMKNPIDDSSYARLAGGGKVVSIASYMRGDLEKDAFAFRDKKVLEIDTMAVSGFQYRRGEDSLSFAKKEGRWYLEKPIISQAQEAKVGDVLSAAAGLEALSFTALPGSGSLGDFGLDKPVLEAEFLLPSGPRRLAIGRKGERVYALVSGASEVCGIANDLLDRFAADAASFREKKVAPFFAFDASEISFRSEAFRFNARRDASGTWTLDGKIPGNPLSREKIENLLTSLAELEAREFIDGAKALPPFPTRIALKTEDPSGQGRPASIVIELSAAEGETVVARNPALPYQFRVGREILQKLPAKLDDLKEGTESKTAPLD
jgi:hypothetical protein